MRTYQSSPELFYDSIDHPEELTDLLGDCSKVYIYPQHEIDLIGGELSQSRSGPNWEGGIMTLVTCKHFMRTFKDFEEGVGIIGVTNKLNGGNYLLYAGIIGTVFPSAFDLYRYLRENHNPVLEAKSMMHNRLGDIPMPAQRELVGNDRYFVENYHQPIYNHCRLVENDSSGNPKWRKEIEYKTRSGKRPQSAIIDPVRINSAPTIECVVPLGRATRAVPGYEVERMFEEAL